MQQIFKTTWNETEDPQQQAANLVDVMQAIASVNWAALSDFDDIAREARRLRLTALAIRYSPLAWFSSGLIIHLH